MHLRQSVAGVAGSDLPGWQGRAVEALRSTGVFVTDLDAVNLDADLTRQTLLAGTEIAAELAARAGSSRGDTPKMLVSGAAEILRNPSIFRWGLQPALLRIAEGYLQTPVAYDGAQVFSTPADGREIATRRWHLDREDRRMIKICLYLNDVGETDGPFEILRREAPRGSNRFRYLQLETQNLQQATGVDPGAGNITTCTGKAGTLILADTARFYHRGRPATHRGRSAIFFSYFSRPPLHPFFCERSGLSGRQVRCLVDGLHPAQQASALWRADLPLLARLIPSSSL